MEKLTLEQKKALCEEYKDHSINVNEIAERYGISRSRVSNIVVKMGEQLRRPKLKKRGATVRTCPKCRKAIDVKGAKFCCFCGADIRSNKELLIERITNAMRKTILLPEDARDEMQRLFLDIKTELSKEG